MLLKSLKATINICCLNLNGIFFLIILPDPKAFNKKIKFYC